MINIRRGTFETNSSSTHSICITLENDMEFDIPEKISLDISEYTFGWEYDKWDSYKEKLAYFILGIISMSYNEGLGKAATLFEELIKDLKEFGVKEVDINGITLHHYESQYYFETDGYVDHASELSEFIEELLANKEMLKRFLFTTHSFILGGNDNSEGYPEINVKYDYVEYSKGN